MAHNVNFSPHFLEAALESPVDEDVVHESFHELVEMQQLHLDEEQRDSLAQLSNPGQEPWGGGVKGRRWCGSAEEDGGGGVKGRPWSGSAEEDGGGGVKGRRRSGSAEEERYVDPLIAERWSAATLSILSSMPSRTIGRSRGAIISQYYNRTMQLRRRRQSLPSTKDYSRSARPSIRGYMMETDHLESDGGERNKLDGLVNNLKNLSVSDRVSTVRAMPISMAEKMEIRRQTLDKPRRSFSNSKIPCCKQLKYNIITAARQSWYSWLSFLHSLQLWHVALKRVSGRFGTGVLSYFIFLKTLLFFNVFLFLLIGAFLVLPQAVYPPTPQTTQGQSHSSGLELFTGEGYFSHSVMYYGYYSNSTLNKSCKDKDTGGGQNLTVSNGTVQEDCLSPRLSYNMSLVYFFTIGLAYFITCILLVYSMSQSFGRSFHLDKSHGMLAVKVFSSWDFKVSKKFSIKLMSDNISTQIKELLSDVNRKDDKKTLCQRLWRLMVHALAWSICIGSTSGCIVAIYFFSEYMLQDLQYRAVRARSGPDLLLKEASLLALPVVVSLINLLLPGLFNAAGWMEEYDSPSVRTYVAIFRNLMLKVSVLGVLCYHWLGRVAVEPKEFGLPCWESFVGQELYRFLLMDFIFTLLDTFFGEFLWRVFSEHILKRKRRPVFDIARHVLELIYGQTLTWLGVLFSPLLPAAQILKLLLLFYVKEGSLMLNCQAPRKPYRASQMTTIFITLLCFPSFLGSTVCVTYTMWSLHPSQSCGPFRGLKTMFESGKKLVEQLEKDNPRLYWLPQAHSYLVENPMFLFLVAGIFLIVIYFHSQVLDGHRKIITLLQEQINNEGEDKKFLITKLQLIHERKRISSPRRLTSQDSAY